MRLARLLDTNLGVSVLAVRMSLNIPTVGQSDLLQTVTDTENGDTGGEDVRVDVRCVGCVDRVRGTREDDTCEFDISIYCSLR